MKKSSFVFPWDFKVVPLWRQSRSIPGWTIRDGPNAGSKPTDPSGIPDGPNGSIHPPEVVQSQRVFGTPLKAMDGTVIKRADPDRSGFLVTGAFWVDFQGCSTWLAVKNFHAEFCFPGNQRLGQSQSRWILQYEVQSVLHKRCIVTYVGCHCKFWRSFLD